jgi:hypothetical protein
MKEGDGRVSKQAVLFLLLTTLQYEVRLRGKTCYVRDDASMMRRLVVNSNEICPEIPD